MHNLKEAIYYECTVLKQTWPAVLQCYRGEK